MEVERVGMILFRVMDLCSDDAKCILKDIKTCKGWGLLCTLDKIKLKKRIILNDEIKDYFKSIGYKIGGLVYIGIDDCGNTYLVRINCIIDVSSKANFEVEVNQIHGDIAEKLMESGVRVDTEYISNEIINIIKTCYENAVSRGLCQSPG